MTKFSIKLLSGDPMTLRSYDCLGYEQIAPHDKFIIVGRNGTDLICCVLGSENLVLLNAHFFENAMCSLSSECIIWRSD